MGKLRVCLLGAVIAVTVSACGGSGSSAAGPPAGLSPYGLILWNFDALAHDHFGKTAMLCTLSSTLEAPYLDYTPSACKLAPSNAQVIRYTPTFADARDSRFSLTDRPPNLAANLEPIKLAGRYVACEAKKTWLELTSTSGWICANDHGQSVSP